MSRRLIIVFLLTASFLWGAASGQQYAFQITFTDKNNTPYSLSSPLVYLSARALARRTAQGIAIDSTDLPVNQAYVDSVVRITGGLFYETSRWLNMCVVLLPDADSAMILNLAGKPFISNVKLVGAYCTNLLRKSNNITPARPIQAAQKGTSMDASYYGATWGQTQLVNGNYLFDNGYSGAGKLIAVLDAGFIEADTHPYLASMWASGRVLDTFDFTYHGTNVFSYDTHGMQVLSTMAGYSPGNFVGTAPLAMYALYITENNTADQPVNMCNMIAGAERADSLGADIITESLGYDLLESAGPCNLQTYPENFDSLDGKTTIAAKAANFATTKGILFVATAGNDGGSLPGFGNHIMTPGDADSALTVGAVDPSGMIAPFSGYGPNAAGVVKPDVCDVGDPAAVCYYAPPPLLSGGLGTSFATPQIAGWAACLWEANPAATPYQVKQAIIKCASNYTDPGPQLGYGIPDFACTETILNIKEVPPPFSSSDWVIASPNPFTQGLKLSAEPAIDGDIDFTLLDMAGRKVASLSYYFYKGYNAPVTMPIPYLPSGIYILKAISSAQQQVIKLEKN